MTIKRILCIFLTLTFVLALAACGKPATDDPAPPVDSTQAAATQAQKASSNNATDDEAIAVTPGTLYALNVKDGEEPVITALRLTGNRLGTEEGINGKEAGVENIRSVFELNEWIDIYPETETKNRLMAFVVPHVEKLDMYSDPFIAPENSASADLVKPEEDGAPWGSLYVHPDYWQAGEYDLVFTLDDIPAAVVMIRLYNEGELDGKSDAELEQMMKE